MEFLPLLHVLHSPTSPNLLSGTTGNHAFIRTTFNSGVIPHNVIIVIADAAGSEMWQPPVDKSFCDSETHDDPV